MILVRLWVGEAGILTAFTVTAVALWTYARHAARETIGTTAR
jgi:hypothetical protein